MACLASFEATAEAVSSEVFTPSGGVIATAEGAIVENLGEYDDILLDKEKL